LGDCQLRTYDLALACTGEYGQFHGGTVPDVLAEYNVAMTRVNGIYERDVTVHMDLIDNTDELIFLNGASDPYTNNNGGAMLGQNQATCDDVIGFNNYDVGHVFSTGGGGIATLNAPCNSNKARGVTGLPSPVNDPFYVDYVAHELGHQYGANHTQNNPCNRVNATAMEPGSASTIMGYAGICSPNVQNNSDDHFHAISIQEMTNFIENGSGGNCPETISTGNSGPTVTTEAAGYVLPVSTPFFLTAIATDPDEDELTYCWEQMDNEIATMPPQSTNTGGPAFRSNSPVLSPTRYFPNLNAVINGNTPTWEVLPSVTRDMQFRVSVRDNAMGGGCVKDTDVFLAFDGNAGPFTVLNPNTNLTWTVGVDETVTWDVANTDQAPVACDLVDIFLSLDGGQTYPILLAEGVPNDGSHTITVPNNVTTEARVQVVCADNIFYDISDEDFEIEEPAAPTFLVSISPATITSCATDDAVYELSFAGLLGFNELIDITVDGLPSGATASFSQNPTLPNQIVTMTISNLGGGTPGLYTLDITCTAPSVTQLLTAELDLAVGAPNSVTLLTPAAGTEQVALDETLTWSTTFFADEYLIEIATSPAFGADVVESATVTNANYTPTGLEEFTIYFWRVTAINLCGESDIIEVFDFQTDGDYCTLFLDEDPGLNIPGNQTGDFTTSFDVSDDIEIDDINILFEVDHTWVGDLSAEVQSPGGTIIQLFDQPGVPNTQDGCSEDNMRVTFDDEATLTAGDLEGACDAGSPFAIDGTYQSIGLLSVLDQTSSQGNWQLTVSDAFNQDGGQLTYWGIEVCRTALSSELVQITNLPLTVFTGAPGTIGSNLLEYERVGLEDTSVTYLVLELPEHGELLLNGTPLALGAAFSQQAVNDLELSYQHDAGPATSDDFLFHVYDDEGDWIQNQTFEIVILEPGSLAGSVAVTQGLACAGDEDAVLEVTAVGGIPPYMYSLEGSPFQNDPVFAGLGVGTYVITVMDSQGIETDLTPITISEPDPIVVNLDLAGSDLTVNASGGTGTLTYSLDGITYQTSNQFEGLDNGDYTVYVKDENDCITTDMITVNNIINVVAQGSELDCFGDTNGTITVDNVVGGETPYVYSLNNGPGQSDPTFTGLPAGTYSVQVSDAQGNIFEVTGIVITEPSEITITPAVNGNDLTVTAGGGTPPFEYSLDGITYQSSNEFPDLDNGDYTIYVRDANGCVVTQMTTISIILSAAAEIQPVTCAGDADGSITVSDIEGGFAPFTYSLDNGPGQSSPTFNNLAAGAYSIEITDNQGNTFELTGLVVPEPDPLTIGLLVSTDTLDVLADGGTPPYEFSIDGGVNFQSTSLFTGLANGEYPVVVQDANGCLSEVDTAVINVSSVIDLTTQWQLALWPNPNSGQFELRGQSDSQADVDWQLVDVLGRRLTGGTFEVTAGSWSESFNLELPAGNYWLQIRTSEGGGVIPIQVVR
jgi:subtilisin-like proprotein convertase family protein